MWKMANVGADKLETSTCNPGNGGSWGQEKVQTQNWILQPQCLKI